MVLMQINPTKVKVGRKYFLLPKGYVEIIAIFKSGYKVKNLETNRTLSKLRTAKDLMLRRPDSQVGVENPKER